MRIYPLLLSVALCSPLNAQGLSGSARDELWAFHRELRSAIAERGPDAIPDFYAPDAVIMPAEAGRLDRNAFVEMVKASGTLEDAYYRAEPEEFFVSPSGNMAYEIGRYEMGFRTPEGPVDVAGDYVAVLEKRDGRWWVTLQVDSPNPPAEPQ